MSTSTTAITAADIMDRSAVLMNDPAKTDYNYDTLLPFVKMALDELSENLSESQSSPLVTTSEVIVIPIGTNALYPDTALIPPSYPVDLTEVQEIGERREGSTDDFIPMKRSEYLRTFEPGDQLVYWAWESQIIKFNPRGARTAREVQLKYLRGVSTMTWITPESIVGPISSRSFLAYKTASLASMFIGENPERAKVLEAKAEQAMDRIESINNKGRQQIMTRHRPFRAAYKARGGF